MKKRVLSLVLSLVLMLPLALTAQAVGNGITTSAGHEVLAKLPAALQRPAQPTTLEQAVGRVGDFYPCDWTLSQSKESVFQEIVALTDSLTAGKATDAEKARAIYDWTSQNIQYDTTANDYWVRQKRGEWLTEDKTARIDHASDPFYVYAQKLAICGGYTDLTWLMLSIAQIPSAVIGGAARTGAPHAWSAALLDGKWLFFDATWKEWDMSPTYHTASDSISFCDGVFQQTMTGEANSTSYYLCPGFQCPANVVMPEGCFDVMAEAFKGCTTLKTITLPSTLTAIETSAFQGCTGLESVTIPAGVAYVHWDSFKDCTNLKSVTFLGKTEVREGAFDGTPMVTEAKEFATVGGVLVKYKGFAREVTIPSGVTAIAEKAFDLNLYLAKVVIPEGVTSIGRQAFRQCAALSDVTIPKSVTAIGDNAFYETPWLKNQGDFPVFAGILLTYQGADVEHIVVPNGVKEIAAGAFARASSARRITLPATLKKIGQKVFSHTYLEEINFAGTEEQWAAVEIVADGATNWRFRSEDGDGAKVNYNVAAYPAAPVQPTTPAIPASGTAHASTQTVNVDGKAVTFYAYALRDANGNDTNYVRLRDIAAALKGTNGQFGVGYSDAEGIFLKRGESYATVGGELTQIFQGDQPYKAGNSPLKVDGVLADLEAITLTDANGGESNYFKLRDLGRALGFNVGYSDEKGIFIQTNRPYTDAD